jgi:GNAT superfamily N-acetyltransferase
MTDFILRRASLPQDEAVLSSLMQGYFATLTERIPQQREAILMKYDAAKMPALMAQFAQDHSRPTGDLRIALIGDTPVGCAMLRTLEPGVAELQRVYVTPEGRGHGIGEALSRAMMDQARADGHRLIRLDTGKPLTEALRLYAKLGFNEIPPYHNLTPQFDGFIAYFECAL